MKPIPFMKLFLSKIYIGFFTLPFSSYVALVSLPTSSEFQFPHWEKSFQAYSSFCPLSPRRCLSCFGTPRRGSDQSHQAQLFLDPEWGCLVVHLSLALALEDPEVAGKQGDFC